MTEYVVAVVGEPTMNGQSYSLEDLQDIVDKCPTDFRLEGNVLIQSVSDDQ